MNGKEIATWEVSIKGQRRWYLQRYLLKERIYTHYWNSPIYGSSSYDPILPKCTFWCHL